jgi:hypothetical protein
MPVVSFFYGITISMYFGDHPPPHVHAEYQGFEALIRIADGEIVRGRLPGTAHRLAREWIALHREKLLTNFDRVRDFRHPERVPGLDHDAG